LEGLQPSKIFFPARSGFAAAGEKVNIWGGLRLSRPRLRVRRVIKRNSYLNNPLRRFKAEFFKALGHPMRILLLESLRTGEKSVNELQAVLGLDQSSVSRQLAVLRTRNIVEDRKEGTTVYYRVRDPAIFQLLDIAREIFNNHLIDTHAMLQQLADEETI
jgi:DNA-binding transcriptional ArsR family regulator